MLWFRNNLFRVLNRPLKLFGSKSRSGSLVKTRHKQIFTFKCRGSGIICSGSWTDHGNYSGSRSGSHVKNRRNKSQKQMSIIVLHLRIGYRIFLSLQHMPGQTKKTVKKQSNFHWKECCLFLFCFKLHSSRKNIQLLHDMFDIFARFIFWGQYPDFHIQIHIYGPNRMRIHQHYKQPKSINQGQLQ